jgi:hypothetical protein
VAFGSHSTPMIQPAVHRDTFAVHRPLARPGVLPRTSVPRTASEASFSSYTNVLVASGLYMFCCCR